METVSFCRICEPTCGMIATVEEGKLVSLRPDKDNPVTKGFSCPKGLEMVHVVNDPDRILHPLRRKTDGTFEEVSWETALAEIGQRLRAVRDRHSAESIGWYVGNPAGFSHSHGIWATGFVKGLGTKHLYSANTQDTSSRFVASALIYGSPLVIPVPDVERSDFVLLVGTNPLVSRGSIMSGGNLREKYNGVVTRGGRVVVVDPRRTETARAYEHIGVRPDGDAWLLMAILHVIFTEGLADSKAIARQSKGIDVIRDAALAYSPETVVDRTGLPAEDVRRLARDLASAKSAAVHGRTGACLGRHATLVNVLLDTLCLVTGNLDRPGGLVFGEGPIDFASFGSRIGAASYATAHSRVGGFPEVIGHMPAPLMAEEINTPGPGQLRALIVSAGNPVLSVPGSVELEQALHRLDLQVAIDIYLNETHRSADYILPAATMYERDDAVLVALDLHLTPFMQWTDAVVPPRGEARPDWEIIDDIARELGFSPLAGLPLSAFVPKRFARLANKLLSPLNGRLTPELVVDLLLRSGKDGDWFGLRPGGLSVAALRKEPHGRVLAPHIETGRLRSRIKGGRVDLADRRIQEALRRLANEQQPDPEYPYRLIGRREIRTHNSWMHNTPKHLDPKRRQRALVNPKDAAELGITDGDVVRIISATGAGEVPAALTDDVRQGTIAVPHGWGHGDAGWQIANAAGGTNVNAINSPRVEDLEPLSGMSHMSGVPVRLEAAAR